jgi:hypothetical protein
LRKKSLAGKTHRRPVPSSQWKQELSTKTMSRRLKHWLLLANHHANGTWILPEGDTRTYEIAPNDKIKKGDTVYLWWNPHRLFYGWGEVDETPRIITVEQPGPNNEIVRRKRTLVVINRKKEIPHITADMMARDSNLKTSFPKRRIYLQF